MRHKQTSIPVGLVGLLTLIAAAHVATGQSRDRFRKARLRMVKDYIEAEGIRNPRVLASMRQVPRHEFVRPGMTRQAYHDGALAIGYKQTISPPFVVAYMTEIIDPQETDRVLEIGTGSGYQAAVLSGLVKDVYTIEIVSQLGRAAERRLKRLGYRNVHPKIGDGYKGWPEQAPFDKIIVTCSPEDVPKPLIEQLKEGGKMIIPLGQRYQQVFHLFEKRQGKLVATKLIPTLFVPMTGASEKQRKIRPDPLKPTVINGGFEFDENNDGRPDHWHYLRQAKLVAEGAREGGRFLRFENSEPGRLSQILQGMALDGRKIGQLRITMWVKYENTAIGTESYHKPALAVHFYDTTRRPIGEANLGPWIGSQDWREVSGELKVPAKTREAIVRIGLNGATGRLSVDGVKLSPRKR